MRSMRYRSLLFPEKLGIKYKNELYCDFANLNYCMECPKCNQEEIIFDLRTPEEFQMDKIAGEIDYLEDLELEQTNVDDHVDIIILLIPLKLQLEEMLTTYHNRGGICNE